MGDEKFEESNKFREDITEIKVSLARLESFLHLTPCQHLSTHEERNRSDIRKLHEKHEIHIKEHHSSTSLRNNWFAWLVLLATLLSNVVPRWLN